MQNWVHKHCFRTAASWVVPYVSQDNSLKIHIAAVSAGALRLQYKTTSAPVRSGPVGSYLSMTTTTTLPH